MKKKIKKIKILNWSWSVFFLGIILTILILVIPGRKVLKVTSTDKFCNSCHIHPHAEASWKKSIHYYNNSGVIVSCIECHLPPKEANNYLIEKAKTGLRDLYGYILKDSASIDWESKRLREHARTIVYDESCINCHQNLFTKELSEDGGTAHLYYERYAEQLDLKCIDCHQYDGHYNPDYIKGQMTGIPLVSDEPEDIFMEPAKVTSFENFTEYIPPTSVSFEMVAIKGGTFKMGSYDNEPFRKKDEGPIRDVKISSFFIGKNEISFDEYMAFYNATKSEIGTVTNKVMKHNASDLDAITGPTPPWEMPDQGWGWGKRPAITMTHYAATIYCKWLSKVTGKTYRLPTEAEWEYACRASTETPYFFKDSPEDFTKEGIWNRLFGPDTAVINSYVIYQENSSNRTQLPSKVKPNPFGLKNMLGNVSEFCSDWYAEDAYSQTDLNVINPEGPKEGTEHVIRGGNYSSDAKDLRSAARGRTETTAWKRSDPQEPKSIWWYTDNNSVGFRIVCELDSTLSIVSEK